MSQFKRFNASENRNWNSSDALEEGTLTWDPDNGLRIHDGYQNGGRQIGITSYQSLNDLPTNLASIQSGGSNNNRQFLRYNSSTYEMEFANDFRIVSFDDIDFPNGTIDVDKAGDVAFDQDAIYYCHQQPNAYSIAYAGSTGWTPAGWLRINSIGPNNKIPQVGDKLTDGSTTSTITSIEAPWQDQGGGATFMLIDISPAVSAWKNGSGNLTVYTGLAPVSDCWAKFSKSYNDLTNKPTLFSGSYTDLTNKPYDITVQTVNFNGGAGMITIDSVPITSGKVVEFKAYMTGSDTQQNPLIETNSQITFVEIKAIHDGNNVTVIETNAGYTTAGNMFSSRDVIIDSGMINFRVSANANYNTAKIIRTVY